MTPRKHHYLSQCYLKGFTKGLSKKSQLVVYDIFRANKFLQKPDGVAAIRDFNRIEIDGVDPNFIEQWYADLESKIGTSLKKMYEIMEFKGEIQEYILLLIAIIGSRSPEKREHWRKFYEKVCKLEMKMLVSSEEFWDKHIQTIQDDGYKLEHSVQYKDMKNFVRDNKYKIDLPNEHHITNEIEMINLILPLLFYRKWKVICTNDDVGTFITSDNPVVLTWTNPEDYKHFNGGPGYGLNETIIYFPVNKYITIVGRFDGDEGIYFANENTVASYNAIQIMFKYKQIYTPKDDFKFVNASGKILTGDQLFDYLGVKPDSSSK
jgi:hypothetical protein